MSDTPQPVVQNPAPAAQPAPKPAGRTAAAPVPQEATLEDRPAETADMSATTCFPGLCQLGEKEGTWAGMKNYECPRCGYATVNQDIARARNPKQFS